MKEPNEPEQRRRPRVRPGPVAIIKAEGGVDKPTKGSQSKAKKTGADPVEDLGAVLSQRVVGQPAVTKVIVPYIQMFQAGLAPEGRPVLAATSGLVLVSGFHGDGGNMIAVLGPRWRIHYYAHLSRLDVAVGRWVGHGDAIGAVSSTGNAAGKPSHLHYAIVTVVPYPWRITAEPQGWKKMFFLDPRIELAD